MRGNEKEEERRGDEEKDALLQVNENKNHKKNLDRSRLFLLRNCECDGNACRLTQKRTHNGWLGRPQGVKKSQKEREGMGSSACCRTKCIDAGSKRQVGERVSGKLILQQAAHNTRRIQDANNAIDVVLKVEVAAVVTCRAEGQKGRKQKTCRIQ